MTESITKNISICMRDSNRIFLFGVTFITSFLINTAKSPQLKINLVQLNGFKFI